MREVQLCLFLVVIFTSFEFHKCRKVGGGRPKPTHHPVTSHTRITTPRHQGTSYTTSPPHFGSTAGRPSWSTTRRPNRSTSKRPSWSTTRRSSGSTLPARPGSPGYNPQGRPNAEYKIEHKYINYPGEYHLPVQSPHAGYFYAPSYHYSSNDVGSTALGLYLGYSLAKLTTPTYSHYSFYDGYRPTYDHYTVHHYYHDKDSVPKKHEIQSNTIVGCVGDSSTICPANTTSLCTTSGTLMCVVSATSTVPCTDNRQVNCIKSTISCVNNAAPECKNSNSTTISIPCISDAKVYGEIKYENNTIVTTNSTTSNGTVNVTSTTPEYSTKYPITTTPVPKIQDVPKNFCVTIIAVPAKKPPTEGEEIFDAAGGIVSNFIKVTWGLS